jgi:hypothetical protein
VLLDWDEVHLLCRVFLLLSHPDVNSWLLTFGFQLHNVIPGYPKPDTDAMEPSYELKHTQMKTQEWDNSKVTRSHSSHAPGHPNIAGGVPPAAVMETEAQCLPESIRYTVSNPTSKQALGTQVDQHTDTQKLQEALCVTPSSESHKSNKSVTLCE